MLVGAGVGLLMVTVWDAVPAALGVLAWGVGGLGIGMAYSPLSVSALAEAEPGQEGTATSALQLSDVLGVALGTGLGGVIIAHDANGPTAGGSALVGVFGVALAMSLVGLGSAGACPATSTDLKANPAVPTVSRSGESNGSSRSSRSGPRRTPATSTRSSPARPPSPSRRWKRLHRILIADPKNAHARSRKLVP